MKYAEVIDGIEPAKLQAALQGRTVKAAMRKGKHMWIDFDSGPSLMLHFGKMTLVSALAEDMCCNLQSLTQNAFPKLGESCASQT